MFKLEVLCDDAIYKGDKLIPSLCIELTWCQMTISSLGIYGY